MVYFQVDHNRDGGRMGRYDLTDEQYALIEPELPTNGDAARRLGCGVPWARTNSGAGWWSDDRHNMDSGIAWVGYG